MLAARARAMKRAPFWCAVMDATSQGSKRDLAVRQLGYMLGSLPTASSSEDARP
jgi:hypothetical protein